MKHLKYKFQKDYPSLTFPWFGEKGSCFLRIRGYEDGSFVFLCSPAENDKRTNITECVEIIFETAIKLLEKDGHLPKQGFLSRQLDSSNFLESRRFQDVAKRSRWVEFRPARVNDNTEADSYALVRFGPGPSWSYLARKTVLRLNGIDEDFLRIESTREGSSADDAFATERVFSFLKDNAAFLAQGRSIGVNIGLSKKTSDALQHRYGDAVSGFLANVAIQV